MSDSKRPRASLRAVFTNWHDYDAPFFAKLRLSFINSATKLRTLSDCCGHPGQPGC